MKRWFVTGTDTGIGKTRVACAVVEHLVSRGLRVAAMKPVAAGCTRTDDGLRNADALALMRVANVPLPYETVNPYALEPAIAPHVAAARAGIQVDIGRIHALVCQLEADCLVIEGAGGWCVPLGETLMFADLARRIADHVVLVVGLRLGCLNHALLTARQVRSDGVPLAGWVANILDEGMPALVENLATLDRLMPAPRLGTLEQGATSVDFLHNEWTVG